MKFFDKLGLTIFSAIVLVISLVLCIVIFGWFDIGLITAEFEHIISNQVTANVILGIQIVLILLAIKCLFFNSYVNEEIKNKSGITLENDNGKLLVSRDAIENLSNLVVKSFDSVENATTKVIVDEDANLKILITMYVHPDAIIKDLTTKLQSDVKGTIKKSLNLDVNEVTVKVKDITVKKEPTIKE